MPRHLPLTTCLYLLAGALLGWTLWAAADLRPSADDYGFGLIVARHGICAGLGRWWMEWTGYLFPYFLNNLLVGWPMAHLPFALASSLPFVLTALGMGLGVTAVLRGPAPRPLIRAGWPLLGVCFWLVFLWGSGAAGETDDGVMLMGRGLTHWQTLNGSYISQFAIMLIAGLWVWRHATRRRSFTLALAILLGLLAGFSSSALSLSLFVWFSGTLGVALLRRFLARRRAGSTRSKRTERTGHRVTFLAALMLAAYVAHAWSPGQARRAEILQPTAINFTVSQTLDYARFTVPYAVGYWGRTFVNTGAVVVLLASFAAGYAAAAEPHINRRRFRAGWRLASFALLHALVTRSAEFLTFRGYWHFVTPYAAAFVATVCFGVAAGGWARRHPGVPARAARAAAVTASVLAAAAAIWIVSFGAREIETREQAWRHGAASMEGVLDLDQPSGSELKYWRQLGQYRDLPERTANLKVLPAPEP